MSGEALKSVVASSDTVASAAATSRQISVEVRRRLVAESLQVGNPGNKAGDLPAQADPLHDCQIELAVDDIRPYEHNPRRVSNARFEQIKESIRASGIRNPLTVTRRPGEAHFIVEAGGNTRLLAIRQLWAETRDARFQRLMVLFRPWRTEGHVLTAHLIENELRGEMTFWDKASGVVALKGRLEAEQGRALPLRQLEEAMKALGLSVNTATLSLYLYATERLRTLGEVVVDLSGLDVKTMQPRLNVMKRYARTRASLVEDDLYATVFEPVFRAAAEQYRQSQHFSALAVCRACEEALARQLDEPVAPVRAVPGPSTRSASAVSTADTGTADADRQVRMGNEFRSNDEPPVVLGRLIEQVRCFAGLAGIEDCLRIDTAAPLGYCMDALTIPADGDTPPPIRQRAWRLLALVSGQFAGPALAAVQEGGAGDGSGAHDAASLAQTKLPAPCAYDHAFFDWLVDAQDETAGAFWDVLKLVRALRLSIPKSHGKDFPPPASGAA